MKTGDIEHQLNRLATRVIKLEEELAGVEEQLLHPVEPARKRPPKQARPPWELDAAAVEGLVDEMYAAVKTGPLEALRLAPPTGDNYLASHAKNVSKLGMFLADRHGLSEASTRTVGICGLLHDSGMETLPTSFVSAQRPLTQEEYQQVRMHPARGAEYIRQHYRFGSLLSSVIPSVVEQHHERVDGTGYPRGLSGDGIHNFARVLAIADSYEAMTTPRPFRAPLHPARAMRTLLVQGYHPPRGAMYDGAMLKTFVWSASLYPVGCEVHLSDGCRANVISPTKDPKRPVVKLITGDHPGKVMDLTQHESISIASREEEERGVSPEPAGKN